MAENSTISTKTPVEQGSPESTRGGYYFTPRVDIFETDDELLVQADVPGVRAEDVDLRYERGELLLHARVSQKRPDHFALREYEVADFYRVFHIHESIDSTKISAECKHGVLTVHLPKADSARPRQVKVRGE
jgi:HSP20 family protein